MVCDKENGVCDKVLCERSCVCVKVVCERWCVTKRCVKDGVWQKNNVQGPKMPCREIKTCH